MYGKELEVRRRERTEAEVHNSTFSVCFSSSTIFTEQVRFACVYSKALCYAAVGFLWASQDTPRHFSVSRNKDCQMLS